ncbi:MAG: putative CRISPR-associated protein [Bacteroidales bacterium]|nr:putative CRISPR-associated protein [Bacteroidales bacterium]
MKKIITTVGTSIYTNLLKKEVFDEFNEESRPILTAENLENLTHKELTAEKYSKHLFDAYEEDILNKWVYGIVFQEEVWHFTDDKFNVNCCAEIKTLNKIGDLKEYEHILITTDTAISYSSARIIREILKKEYEISEQNIKIEIISGLQIYEPKKFQTEGANNLIKIITENKNAILNISGGYKAIIPILTIIAQIEQLPVKYIYEESEEIISIPPMPLDFDFTFIEENYLAFEQIRPNKKENNLPEKEEFKNLLAKKEDDLNRLLELKLVEQFSEEKIRLTLFGRLLFNKYEELYNKNIFSRQKLLGEVIEYKIYEYYKENEVKSEVKKGKEVGDENYDIDIYIKRENEIEVNEVKHGGNIPIRKKEKNNNTIEYRLTEGSFKYIVENEQADKYIFNLVAYYHTELLHRVKNKLKSYIMRLILMVKM